MSEFDISSYLNKILADKQTEETNSDSLISDYTKARDLLDATSRKTFLLQEQSQSKREALAKESENSWITKLGLEYDSGLGAPLNWAASALDTTRRQLTEAIAAPFSLRGQAKEQLIDTASMSILKRQEAGEQLTPEELKIINTPVKSDLSIGPVSLPATINSQTPKELYEGYFGLEGSKRIAREFRKATDTSSIVNREAEGLMQQELLADPKAAEALDRISKSKITDIKKEDVATLITNALKVGGNNPLAVSNLIASNLPYVVLANISPTALAAANIGYSQTYYDKWSDGFAKREGREPTLEEKKQAQLEAFSLAAAETAGDLLTAGTAKALGASLGLGKKAVGGITPEAFKASLGAFGQTTAGAIASKAVPVIANAAKATGQVALASAGEAGTEGYQTNVENRLENGVNASPEDIYFGMTAGALSSGGITAASAGVGLTRDVFGAATEAKEIYQNRQEAKTEAYSTAVETGDVTPLVNKPNPLQNDWVGATEAIIENASLEGKTDEDVKAALGKVDKEIVSKLEASIKSFSLNTEAKVDIYNKEIEKINTFLEQNPDSEKAKALLAKYTAARDAPIDPAKEAQANKFIGQLQTKLNEVVSLREGLAAREVESEANVLETAKAIVTPASTAGTTDTAKPAVDVPTFIVRAMKLRGTKSPELATAIESVISSGKATPEEIKTLRILADEVIASNKAKNVSKVSENVLFGSGEIKGVSPTPGIDFKGVFNYQDTFEKALAIGDKETANREFGGLKTFVTAHGKKQEAYSQLKPNQMVKFTNKGEWQISDIPKGYTQQQAVEEARKNGGFAWFGDKPNKGYTNTMANINNEISIMVPVLQKMSLQIGKPINNKEVVSVKQTPKAKQASQEGQEVSGTTVVNPGTKQASTGTSEATTPPTINKPKVLDVWYGNGTSTASHKEFSNLAERSFTYEGSKYLSVEHAYQTLKSGKFDKATYDKYTKAGVKIPGKNAFTKDGTNVKLMKALMLESFKQNETARKALIDTGDSVFTHVNDKASIWGKKFPELLTEVREELKSSPKVSVPSEGTSTPNNTGAPNGQGQKEKVLSTPPTEVGSGSTQQPTTAPPTEHEAVEDYVYAIELIDKKLVITDNSKSKKEVITEDGSLYSLIDNADDELSELGFEFKDVGKYDGSPYITWVKYNPNDETKLLHKVSYFFGDKYVKHPWVFWNYLDSTTKNEDGFYKAKQGTTLEVVFKYLGITNNTNATTSQVSKEQYQPTNVDYSGLARVGTLLGNNQGSKRENEDGSISYIFDSLSITLKQGIISVLDMRNSIALIDGTVKPKEFSNWEAALKEVENISKVELTPQQELINESQKELLEEEAASTPEATTEGESQGSTDDTTGDGTSSSDNSDELNAGEEVIKEEARYTSKQETLKRIKQIKQSIDEFFVCAFK